ncbi:endo-1,4-beta-xylanase [uncultured Paraglaciecola sp.]|uniref:endo-1,4-beta-xylanase n=1 Tax=uncultured Paraglaciecola sp. TaxID=1765024 RepID=UPI0030D8D2BB|tara:strand:+ start:365038 stop:367257 length:2220 start_codon:yes stop_codon:yes gene_type:complete
MLLMSCNSKNIAIALLSISFLWACGGGGGKTASPTPISPPTPAANVAPTVDAGPDQVVDEKSNVTLSGSASDSDGSINSYSWALTSSGTTVLLTGADTSSVTFNAPDVASSEELTFSLTVTDDDGATSTDTLTVTINNISSPTTPPTGEMTVPEGGTFILSANTLSSATFWEGNGSQPVGSRTIVAVDHQKFSQALEVDITNPSGVTWNGNVSIGLTEDVKVGDNLLLHLYFRTMASQYETGTGFTRVLLQGPEPEYLKLISRNINSANEWEEFFIPATVTQDFAKNELTLMFELGAGDKPQRFQLAGIELYNYQQNIAFTDLPQTKATYGGRDEDATWRTEAAARIEQYRKGDFTLTIQTPSGDKITNTDININMRKHAYHFGSAVVSNMLIGDGADEQIYQSKVLELFNQAGPENDLKWAPWAGEWGSSFNQETTLAGLQWLKDHDFYTRGHVLVWPSKRNLPDVMQQYLPDDPANADPQALVAVKSHIDDITSRTASLLSEWDVLNEPYDNHYLMDAFGDEVMVDWFEQARTNLPDHKLYINDYSILSSAGSDTAHQQHYQDTIEYLYAQNAPIDGIGLQSHFNDVLTDITKVYSIIERFHLAFPSAAIRSTEFDVSTLDEQLQADYTRDFLTIFFSHPATVGVQLWGFWAGRHWYPDAALYDLDWREKPNAVAWKDLVFNQWHSQFAAKTNAEGTFSGRGFYGEYEVTFSYQGTEQTLSFSVNKDAQNNIILTTP